MKRVGWRYYFSLFLEGDKEGAAYRLLGAIITLIIVSIIGRIWEPAAPEGWVQEWVHRLPLLGLLPVDLLAFILSFLHPSALRHWIAPLAAIVLGIMAGALYLQDIFEFGNFRKAFGYLFASLFGLGYPELVIRHGKKEVKPEEPNTLDKIGGPGFLDIKLGNAVLLERGVGPTAVLGAGRFFVRRFETIREIVDLREIYRKKPEVGALTKDGIDVKIRDVEATFRIDTGRQQQRTEADPYPFSVGAVRLAVYTRAVAKDGGEPGEWADGVMNAITGRVSGWVARQRLDRITAPADEDPRAAVRAEFGSPAARQQMARMGAELIWVNMGHLDTPNDNIEEQRLKSWQSFWESQDKVTLAQGEALRVAYRELGRAEGQADMLLSISHALDTTQAVRLFDDRAAELILLKVGQVLEAMSAHPGLSELKSVTATDELDQQEAPPPAEPGQDGKDAAQNQQAESK